MPDYNLESIVNGDGENLIEIGFAVEGYEVDNMRGKHIIGGSGGAAEAGTITISPGGYIDDDAAKQQVLNWNPYGSFVVQTAENESSIVTCTPEAKLRSTISFR